jgi:hypothetical protein
MYILADYVIIGIYNRHKECLIKDKKKITFKDDGEGSR